MPNQNEESQKGLNIGRGRGPHRSFNQRRCGNNGLDNKSKHHKHSLRDDFPSSFQSREEAQKHFRDHGYRIGWLRTHYQNGISYDETLHTLTELELLDDTALFEIFLKAHIALF